MSETVGILRHQARDGNVFDRGNDTVIVTRSLLTTAADEIERLRAALKPFADLGYTGLPNQSHIDRAREVLGADEQIGDGK